MTEVLVGQYKMKPTFTNLIEHGGNIVRNVFLEFIEVEAEQFGLGSVAGPSSPPSRR